MTFYEELQLNQSGSKALISGEKDKKEKRRHIWVYIFKVILTVMFCVVFVSGFSLIFGTQNSIAGVVILLSVMTFRQADFGVNCRSSVWIIFSIYTVLAAGPHVSNLVPTGWAFLINLFCIGFIVILGCHNVVMSNHATFVLGYLLLQGYDVSGAAYAVRVLSLILGASATAWIFYRNHKKLFYKRGIKDIFKEFHFHSFRTQWQLRMTLGVSASMLVAIWLQVQRPMWIGVAVMSLLLPFQKDGAERRKWRAAGNMIGAGCFIGLYYLLPEESHFLIGMIGGIGVGFCAAYGWQTVFNSFGALGIAVGLFGIWGAVFWRIFANLFATVFSFAFEKLFGYAWNGIGKWRRNNVAASD